MALAVLWARRIVPILKLGKEGWESRSDVIRTPQLVAVGAGCQVLVLPPGEKFWVRCSTEAAQAGAASLRCMGCCAQQCAVPHQWHIFQETDCGSIIVCLKLTLLEQILWHRIQHLCNCFKKTWDLETVQDSCWLPEPLSPSIPGYPVT